MYLKPIKTYGKEYQCKIYKHYVVVNNKIDNIDFPYGLRVVNGDNYRTVGFMDKTRLPEVNSVSISKKIYTKNPKDTFITLDKIGQCAICSNHLYVLTKLPKDLTTEEPVIEMHDLDYKGDLITTTDARTSAIKETLIKQYELNKYFYFKDMYYMPIDDIQDNEQQYLKGNVMKTQSRVIRYDLENELEIHDIVVIDNQAYIVEDITTNTRVGMNMYKTYIATLMKLGV